MLVQNWIAKSLYSINFSSVFPINGSNSEVLKTEKELRNFAKRSIQTICKIPKGQELIEGVNFDVLRPGKKSRGLEPRFLDSLNGKKSKTDIDDGEGITDNSWAKQLLTQKF